MGKYCEKVVHSRYVQRDSSPWSANGRRAHRPAGTVGPVTRGRDIRLYEGWLTSYGVCGHLLDSLSAWGHSATLFKPEQAHFGRFHGIMFFRQDSLKSAGRCHADPRINTRPVHVPLPFMADSDIESTIAW